MSQEPATNRTSLRTAEKNAVFESILFDRSRLELVSQSPEFFSDLNLDQVIAAITSGREEYNLQPFFHTLLEDLETVNYRHDIFRDLENQETLDSIRSFAIQMRAMRSDLSLAEKLHYKHQKQALFFEAIEIYVAAVHEFRRKLEQTELRSAGLLAFRRYITDYAETRAFAWLSAETESLRDALARIQYCLHIRGGLVEVTPYESEVDYGVEVLGTFSKFSQGASEQYRFQLPSGVEMNHVEAAILDLVARLYPQIFAALDEYCRRYSDCLDSTVTRFDREIQFYLAVIDHIDRMKKSGLCFCYPSLSSQSKEVFGRDVFDLALAWKLVSENKRVVSNDFHLQGPERILVITGPNQGGKTTFARTFGQLHYLAKIGCPAPGAEARLFLCDRLFTHFEREEEVRNLTGKLEDDLLRMREVLGAATSNSILIMNESFLSTTLNDALFLSKEIIKKIIERGMLCVTVTFIYELASFNENTVSMVSTVDPSDPTVRTFKVVRKPADGLAYAAALAAKHRLTSDGIKSRISRNRKGRIDS